MQYRAIFDVREIGYDWTPVGIGGLFVLASIVLFFVRDWLWPAYYRRFIVYLVPFGVVMTVVASGLTWSSQWRLKNALSAGHVEVVEGSISLYAPLSSNAKGSERFVVGQHQFEYSPYILSPGFRYPDLARGKLAPGVFVRVFHKGGDIARLEVAEQ